MAVRIICEYQEFLSEKGSKDFLWLGLGITKEVGYNKLTVSDG